MSDEAPPPLPDGPFEGREAFRSRLLASLDAAARAGWRELIWSDADFADWPLGERATTEALQGWCASGRSFSMVAEHFRVFEREHARFVRWRQGWGHIIECRTCRGPGAAPVPSAIWTPGWFMQRVDPILGRGVSGTDPGRRRSLKEAIDECWRQGKPGFPSSTLGL